LHLLVTDPATSPRKDPGKIVFGALYGVAVFALFDGLNRMGAPEFYDKLLCVPFLNLGVRALDRGSDAFLSLWAKLKGFYPKWTPRQLNWVYMSIWVLCFSAMTATGFLTTNQNHPGGHAEVWRQACEEGRYNACRTFARILSLSCASDSTSDCSTLGKMANEGRQISRDPVLAGRSLSHACDLGVSGACTSLTSLMKADGKSMLSQSCDRGDGMSCFILGSQYSGGNGVQRNATPPSLRVELAHIRPFANSAIRIRRCCLAQNGVRAQQTLHSKRTPTS
jgi:TPR repeat protein